MRPTDGLFSLSLEGAQRLVSSKVPAKCFVIVKEDVSSFVAEGGDVFAVHVLKADEDIRSKDEIIAIDRKKKILGVGRSVLSGNEMQAFRRGVAVKIRRGFSERLSKV